MLFKVAAAVAVALVASGAAVAWTGTAHAQPGQGPPCIGMPQFANIPVDPNLMLSGLVALSVPTGTVSDDGTEHRKFRATWVPLGSDALCTLVFVRRAGQELYDGFAVQLLFASATELEFEAIGNAGEYCFRFVVLSATARSEFMERCLDFPARGPIPPDSGGASDDITPAPPDSDGASDAVTPVPPDAGAGSVVGGRDLGSVPLFLALGLAGVAALFAFGPPTLRRIFPTRR